MSMQHFFRTFLAALMYSLHLLAAAQNFTWARSLEGQGQFSNNTMFPGESLCTAMTVDAAGSIYMSGNCNDTIDFDPGPGTFQPEGAFDDLYLAKYSENGDLVWANIFPGWGNLLRWNHISDIEVDPQGNIVILGRSFCKLDMDPGPDTLQLELTDNDVSYAFIAKYDPEGGLLWAKSFGETYAVMPQSLALTGAGEFLITARFYLAVDPDPSANEDQLTSPDHGFFFAKYDADGNYMWAKPFTGTGYWGDATCIKVAADGNIYLSGFFSGTVDFDPGPAYLQMSSEPDGLDTFIAKYDPAGGFIWSKHLDVTSNTNQQNVVIETDPDGSLVVFGSFRGGLVDLDPGSGVTALQSDQQGGSYIARFSANGALIWGKGLLGFAAPTEVELGDDGSIYVAGSSYNTDMDPSPAVAMLHAPGCCAFAEFWGKYDREGNYCWSRTMGNQGYGGSTILPTFAVLGDRQYFAGGFKQTADFDPGSDSLLITSTSNGTNAYFARFDGLSIALDLGDDRTICAGTSLILDPGVANVDLIWQDGSIGPTFLVQDEGLYIVTEANNNCPLMDSVYIAVEDCSLELELPNVFSPNGDGQNDRFVPVRMSGVGIARLEVYNRWGQVIYTGNDLALGWNGKVDGQNVSEGTYMWTVSWTYLNDEELHNQHGHVTLLR